MDLPLSDALVVVSMALQPKLTFVVILAPFHNLKNNSELRGMIPL